MKIEQVIITITNLNDNDAAVRITTDPQISENDFEELDDSPAAVLGSEIWAVIQEIFNDNMPMAVEGNTLQ